MFAYTRARTSETSLQTVDAAPRISFSQPLYHNTFFRPGKVFFPEPPWVLCSGITQPSDTDPQSFGIMILQHSSGQLPPAQRIAAGQHQGPALSSPALFLRLQALPPQVSPDFRRISRKIDRPARLLCPQGMGQSMGRLEPPFPYCPALSDICRSIRPCLCLLRKL